MSDDFIIAFIFVPILRFRLFTESVVITVAILSSFPISIIISEFISSIFIFSIFPSSWFLALMFKFVSNESKTVLDLKIAITSSLLLNLDFQ